MRQPPRRQARQWPRRVVDEAAVEEVEVIEAAAEEIAVIEAAAEETASTRSSPLRTSDAAEIDKDAAPEA